MYCMLLRNTHLPGYITSSCKLISPLHWTSCHEIYTRFVCVIIRYLAVSRNIFANINPGCLTGIYKISQQQATNWMHTPKEACHFSSKLSFYNGIFLELCLKIILGSVSLCVYNQLLMDSDNILIRWQWDEVRDEGYGSYIFLCHQLHREILFHAPSRVSVILFDVTALNE